MFQEIKFPVGDNLKPTNPDSKQTYNLIEATYGEKSDEIPKNTNLSLFMALGKKWLQLGGDDNYKPPENLNASSEEQKGVSYIEAYKRDMVKLYQQVLELSEEERRKKGQVIPDERVKRSLDK